MILVVGEALVEFRRLTADGQLAVPGEWAGPFPSGAPAILASVAARLGAEAALVAGVGADSFGAALTARLARDGVIADGICVVAERRTGIAFVAYAASGDRDFWFSVPDSAAVVVDRAAMEGLLPRADWLHVCGSTLGFGGAIAATVEAAAADVLRRGGRLSVDPNVRPGAHSQALERTARLAAVADVVFPSEGELEALGLAEAKLVERGALICRTRGAGGVTISGREVGPEPVTVPAPEVEEVDATGAGDTFAGAWIAATLAGARPVAAARVACSIAARSVGVLGAMELALGPEDLDFRGEVP